jgi:hypothetical protein
MADRLIFGRVVCRAFCLFLAGCALPAWAQSGFADPTRPPGGMAGGDPSLAIESGGPVLQSVKIPKKGKPSAVISGQQVVLGELFGESRLTALTEREAVLEGPAGIERLRLIPGVEKTNIVAKTPVAKSGQSRGKP